jgi:hypothetical protein
MNILLEKLDAVVLKDEVVYKVSQLLKMVFRLFLGLFADVITRAD